VKGNLIEIFSSYQGEGGSVPGSCFGKRQIFVRFAGCNLAHEAYGTKGCVWCDTTLSHQYNPERFKVETAAGSKEFKEFSNPVSAQDVYKQIESLITTDLHSISFTGGEPCMQKDFLIELNRLCHEHGLKTYLETNGSIPWDEVFGNFDFCCCDLKDATANAAKDWKKLILQELDFIHNFLKHPGQIFAKLVFTAATKEADVDWITKQLAEISVSNRQCPLVLQIVTDTNPPNENQISMLMNTAAKHISVDILSLSMQIHKYLNLL
jgi:organic radical activating enzyme